MNTKFKFVFILHFLFIINNIYGYEIVRDPIFENYFSEVSEDLKLNKKNVFLVKNNSANAFVIEDNIYITTGLLKAINDEDTLKAIYLHEYAHIIKNHFESKKIRIEDIMEPAPPIVENETPASTLAPLIKYSKCILVRKGTKIIGIITGADVLKMVE